MKMIFLYNKCSNVLKIVEGFSENSKFLFLYFFIFNDTHFINVLINVLINNFKNPKNLIQKNT